MFPPYRGGSVGASEQIVTEMPAPKDSAFKVRRHWGIHPMENPFARPYQRGMKTLPLRIALLALSSAGLLALGSCETRDYDEVRHDGHGRTGHLTYTTLPADYEGDAYYYNNRYYAGGRYETGRYSYGGRTYTTRYFHDGRYLYGGDYRQHRVSTSYQRQSTRPSGSTQYLTYQTLPTNYSGDAYYYGNRYYAGGRYEPGRYTYRGRSYDHRYFHNGQYLYGGTYRQHGLSDARQSHDYRSSDRNRVSRPRWSR